MHSYSVGIGPFVHCDVCRHRGNTHRRTPVTCEICTTKAHKKKNEKKVHLASNEQAFPHSFTVQWQSTFHRRNYTSSMKLSQNQTTCILARACTAVSRSAIALIWNAVTGTRHVARRRDMKYSKFSNICTSLVIFPCTHRTTCYKSRLKQLYWYCSWTCRRQWAINITNNFVAVSIYLCLLNTNCSNVQLSLSIGDPMKEYASTSNPPHPPHNQRELSQFLEQPPCWKLKWPELLYYRSFSHNCWFLLKQKSLKQSFSHCFKWLSQEREILFQRKLGDQPNE